MFTVYLRSLILLRLFVYLSTSAYRNDAQLSAVKGWKLAASGKSGGLQRTRPRTFDRILHSLTDLEQRGELPDLSEVAGFKRYRTNTDCGSGDTIRSSRIRDKTGRFVVGGKHN